MVLQNRQHVLVKGTRDHLEAAEIPAYSICEKQKYKGSMQCGGPAVANVRLRVLKLKYLLRHCGICSISQTLVNLIVKFRVHELSLAPIGEKKPPIQLSFLYLTDYYRLRQL